MKARRIAYSLHGSDEDVRLVRACPDAELLRNHRRTARLRQVPVPAPLVPAIPEAPERLDAAIQERLAEIASTVQRGTRPAQVLDLVYESFRGVIPFVRIGCALLEQDNTVLRAFWGRAEYTDIHLPRGYGQPIAGSSLEPMLETLQPRILNDLEAYLADHPDSDSTRRVIREGVRSNLTCPLVSFKGPLGFLFFSFSQTNVYRGVHVAIFKQLAAQVSSAFEKARMLEDLERSNQRLEAVLRTVSHDLRNPLGVIRSFAEMIQDGSMGPVTADQVDLLKDIRHESTRLLGMAQDLTDLRAIVAGRLELDLGPTDVAELARARVRAAAPAAAVKQIELVLDAPDRVPLSADARRLEQVLDNLVGNAIKYTLPGTTIRVVVEDGGDEVLVAVIDQGPGIPPGDRDKLFTEFGRTSVLPSAGESSTGLGLSIVRHLARAHGGEADVETTVGVGSTFYVRLPRR